MFPGNWKRLAFFYASLRLSNCSERPLAASTVDEAVDGLMKRLLREDPHAADMDLDSVRIGVSDPVILSLVSYAPMAQASGTSSFILCVLLGWRPLRESTGAHCP